MDIMLSEATRLYHAGWGGIPLERHAVRSDPHLGVVPIVT
jgi:hypothetical protein